MALELPILENLGLHFPSHYYQHFVTGGSKPDKWTQFCTLSTPTWTSIAPGMAPLTHSIGPLQVPMWFANPSSCCECLVWKALAFACVSLTRQSAHLIPTLCSWEMAPASPWECWFQQGFWVWAWVDGHSTFEPQPSTLRGFDFVFIDYSHMSLTHGQKSTEYVQGSDQAGQCVCLLLFWSFFLETSRLKCFWVSSWMQVSVGIKTPVKVTFVRESVISFLKSPTSSLARSGAFERWGAVRASLSGKDTITRSQRAAGHTHCLAGDTCLSAADRCWAGSWQIDLPRKS